jgi:hypothetical protein
MIFFILQRYLSSPVESRVSLRPALACGCQRLYAQVLCRDTQDCAHLLPRQNGALPKEGEWKAALFALLTTEVKAVSFAQGKYFLFLERVSQLHRELVPIQMWLIYLLNGYERIPGKVMGVILVAVYMVFKGKSLIARGKAFRTACEKLIQSRVSYYLALMNQMIQSNIFSYFAFCFLSQVGKVRPLWQFVLQTDINAHLLLTFRRNTRGCLTDQ